jgi:hypothetical protein
MIFFFIAIDIIAKNWFLTYYVDCNFYFNVPGVLLERSNS